MGVRNAETDYSLSAGIKYKPNDNLFFNLEGGIFQRSGRYPVRSLGQQRFPAFANDLQVLMRIAVSKLPGIPVENLPVAAIGHLQPQTFRAWLAAMAYYSCLSI
ncbi:MAG: hypothetical protein M0R33_11000 [Methylomonas sp.]|nr:hypothetical protein [Methylomonas sp.]